jgi:hypothetical protein
MSNVYGFRQSYALCSGIQARGQQQTQGLTPGQQTDDFDLTPRNGKKNVLGAWIKFKATLTATGAMTPTTGTDALDLFIGQAGGGYVQLSPSGGTSSRAKSITRQMVEFIWAYCTDSTFTVAAAPTFTTSGTADVVVNVFFPVGGEAAIWKAQLCAAITGVYSSAVTISYTSITSYIVSSDFAGVVAYQEEFTASLGAAYQSILKYTPKQVAPDVVFMAGEDYTTITQLSVTDIDSTIIENSVDTDTLEAGAAAIAPIAGTTYTTSAGFVFPADRKTFLTFDVNFSSATTHYIGYLQVAGGASTSASATPMPTAASPAVNNVGAVTASGGVAAKVGGGAGPTLRAA